MPVSDLARKVRFRFKKRTCPQGACLGSRSDPARKVRFGIKKRSRPLAFPPEGAFWEQEGAALRARHVHFMVKKMLQRQGRCCLVGKNG